MQKGEGQAPNANHMRWWAGNTQWDKKYGKEQIYKTREVPQVEDNLMNWKQILLNWQDKWSHLCPQIP